MYGLKQLWWVAIHLAQPVSGRVKKDLIGLQNSLTSKIDKNWKFWTSKPTNQMSLLFLREFHNVFFCENTEAPIHQSLNKTQPSLGVGSDASQAKCTRLPQHWHATPPDEVTPQVVWLEFCLEVAAEFTADSRTKNREHTSRTSRVGTDLSSFRATYTRIDQV